MNRFDLMQFPDDATLARVVAKRWLGDLARAVNRTCYGAALSGGRIAQRLFQELAGQSSDRAVFGAVHFFWADERCVPPADPESNFAAAQRLLFDPLRIGDRQIHRIQGELDPAVAAAQAEAELLRIVSADAQRQPVLDLVLLGLGEDGHIASLFPGEPDEVRSSSAVYRAVIGPKPPPRRVTLNYAALRAARQVWVLASGPGKERALRDSISDASETPLGHLLRLRSWTSLFTDIDLAV